MNLIGAIEEGFKKELTDFNVGDTVKVFVKVVEGDKERIQPFQGVVIARKGSGARETFMVRKISFGVGVEKIFPVYSPNINKIEVIKQPDAIASTRARPNVSARDGRKKMRAEAKAWRSGAPL